MKIDTSRPTRSAFSQTSGQFVFLPGAIIISYFVVVSVVKLILVANREIVAALRPHDDYWHIQAAAHWVWGRAFNELTLAHLPIYAIYVAISGATGIPLRISIEIVYLVCAALLASSLGRLGLRPAIQAAVFGLLAFHPDTYEGFDFALAEMLYACLMLAFVGLLIRLVVPVSRYDVILNAIQFACVSAFLWYLRKESIIIGGLIFLMAFGIVAALVLKLIGRREAICLVSRLIIWPLLAITFLGSTVSAANGLRYGLWSKDQLSATNYVRMFSGLLSILPDHPTRFVSVTRNTRELAYTVSPTFRELQPFLDGNEEHWYKKASRMAGIEGGEIGAGWFYWALIDSAKAAGHFDTPLEAETFYGRVADEIDAALKDGRLPYRHAILPYVDPNLAVWLPYIPSSFVTLTKALFPTVARNYPPRSESVVPDVAATYDRVANRRAAIVRSRNFDTQGWVLSSSDLPIGVEVIKEDGERIPSRFEAVQRHDVKPLVGQEGHLGPDSLGFNMSWSDDETALSSLRFKVTLEGNKSAISGPIGSIPLGQVIQLTTPEPNLKVFFAVDRLVQPALGKRTVIVQELNYVYPVIFEGFSAFAVIYLIYLIGRRQCYPGLSGAILLFMLAIIVSRVLFFAIIDASAWSAEQTRYLLPAAILIPVVPGIVFTFRRRVKSLE